MENKRVSQLVELLAPDVVSSDLLLIVDTSNRESKKITVSNFSAFLNSSGSIISVKSTTSDTASYILGSGVVGSVISASYAIKSSNSDSSSISLNSSLSISSSYSNTASWAINVLNNGTTLQTASIVPITASWANNVVSAKTASFLLYTGFNNGTSSYAITSQNVNHSTTSDTASFLNNTLSSIASASHSDISDFSVGSLTSKSASFLVFSPTNGTASYALTAGGSPNNGLINYGMFLALEQSASFAQLDDVAIFSSLGTNQPTTIEAFGTAILNYTSSVFNTGSVSLILLNRLTGITQSIDSTQISYNVNAILNAWNTLSTGSISCPFELIGQSSLRGHYLVNVTSSFPNVALDIRTVRFKINSLSNNVTVNTAENIDFFYSPTQSYSIFSSNVGGPFQDQLAGLLSTGSSNIKTLNLFSGSINNIRYIWKCINLTDFSCSLNPSITNLNYSFPNTMSNLYCESCSISSIADLSNTQIVNLKVGNNSLLSIPNLPNTLTYFDFSNNMVSIVTASVFPSSSLKVLKGNNNAISFITPSVFPVTLVSASFRNNKISSIPNMSDGLSQLIISNNTLLGFPSASLPPSMSYLDMSSCSVMLMPTMSFSMSYLDISHNPLLTNDQIQIITDTLVSNGRVSGSFLGTANGAPTIPIYNDLVTLSSSLHWTVSYDSFP